MAAFPQTVYVSVLPLLRRTYPFSSPSSSDVISQLPSNALKHKTFMYLPSHCNLKMWSPLEWLPQ